MQSKQGLCRTDPIDTGPPGPHGLYGHWTCRAAGPGGGGETETKITPAKTNPPAFAWEEPGETGPRGSGGDRKAAAAAVGYVPAASHPAPGITPPGFRLKMWSGRRAVVQFQIITHISDNRVLYLFSSLSIKKKKKNPKCGKGILQLLGEAKQAGPQPSSSTGGHTQGKGKMEQIYLSNLK